MAMGQIWIRFEPSAVAQRLAVPLNSVALKVLIDRRLSMNLPRALCILATCCRARGTPTLFPASSNGTCSDQQAEIAALQARLAALQINFTQLSCDGSAINATNATCPTKLSEHRPFTKVFVDEACVAAMPPRSDGTCPIETVDGFAKYYFGALCLVATIVSFMSVLFNVSLLQLGGIPSSASARNGA